MEIKAYLSKQQERIERELAVLMLSASGSFSRHIEAMRYSLFFFCYRLRPILCLAAAETVDGSEPTMQKAMPVACALECIHTYSLIHDDLPAMDNDELRRGKPTNHMVYGEAAAILAGDGLLTYAFDLLSSESTAALPTRERVRLIHTIAVAAGPQGMVGGQSLDMLYAHKPAGYEILREIHKSKTGALITASTVCGAIIAGAEPEQESSLREYGEQIGLAFQIVDDLLDLEASTEELGKAAGRDIQEGKLTYPSLFGVETSRTMAKEAVEAALHALCCFDDKAEPLRALAKYIVLRRK